MRNKGLVSLFFFIGKISEAGPYLCVSEKILTNSYVLLYSVSNRYILLYTDISNER